MWISRIFWLKPNHAISCGVWSIPFSFHFLSRFDITEFGSKFVVSCNFSVVLEENWILWIYAPTKYHFYKKHTHFFVSLTLRFDGISISRVHMWLVCSYREFPLQYSPKFFIRIPDIPVFPEFSGTIQRNYVFNWRKYAKISYLTLNHMEWEPKSYVRQKFPRLIWFVSISDTKPHWTEMRNFERFLVNSVPNRPILSLQVPLWKNRNKNNNY